MNWYMVEQIFLHSDLGAVEDRGLIHVIPGVEMLRTALVVLRQETAGPIVAHFGAEAFHPC